MAGSPYKQTNTTRRGTRAKKSDPRNRQEIQNQETWNQGECSELHCNPKQYFADNEWENQVYRLD